MKRPWDLLLKIRRLRNDSIAVEIESCRAVNICAIGDGRSLLKTFQNLSTWMMVHVARSHGDDGETRLHGCKQIGVSAACAAMMCHLQKIRRRPLGRDELFRSPFRVGFQQS